MLWNYDTWIEKIATSEFVEKRNQLKNAFLKYCEQHYVEIEAAYEEMLPSCAANRF